MAQGCFEVKIPNDQPYNIVCYIIPKFSMDGIPIDQQNLYVEIERTASILKSLEDTSDATKNEYFSKLLSLAQAGLTGPAAQPDMAMLSLNALKHEVCVRESSRIKSSHMFWLGLYALGFILGARYCADIANNTVYSQISVYCYVFIGAMLGTWFSFGVRKMELSFEELSVIEEDGINSSIHLAFVGLSSIILMLFIDSGIITLSIGNISTDQISNSVTLQLLLGVLAGLVEYKLASGLFNKANAIIGDSI